MSSLRQLRLKVNKGKEKQILQVADIYGSRIVCDVAPNVEPVEWGQLLITLFPAWRALRYAEDLSQ